MSPTGSGGAGMTVGTGGAADPGTGTGTPVTGSGGAAATGGSLSTPPAGTGGAAGSMSSGTGGMEPSGSAGGGSEMGCTRELLASTVDAYFVALAAHDPSSLPLADTVKFTENGELLELGEGLWQSAGMVKHTQSALDVESCSSATQAVVPDGAMDIPLALRLKLVDRQITEVETIAVRPGDYQIFGSSFASNPQAIIAADQDLGWEQAVPAAERNTREEITGWIDKYFRMFPRGICNVTSDCTRLENGGGSFMCMLGGSCASGAPSGTAALEPRLILADIETGIGAGFTMFMGNTDMHMIKMHGGQVHAVHAILGGASSSGWE
jgi:hypothetical protein